MRSRRFAAAAGLVAVAVALAVAGCGDTKTGEVTGTVTVNGQTPPIGSSITFTPADGRAPGAGATIESGKYVATKVPIGTAKVQVRVPKFAAEKAPRAGPGGEGERVVGDLLVTDDSGKTEMTYEVKPGKNEKNWDLKTKDK
jgi:hypothetical protein